MALKVYSEYCIDVIFDDGPLGFAIGGTEEGFSIVSNFVKKDDGTILPLEGSNVVQIGWYILSINNQSVIEMDFIGVCDMLNTAKRPLRIRFAKPASRMKWKRIKLGNGMEKIKKWDDSDLYLPVRLYKFSEMSTCFILPREFDESINCSLTPLYRNGPIFECEVREACFNGISDPFIRANVWKMLLRAYPYRPSRWYSARASNRENYVQFVDEFITSRNAECGLQDCILLPNPLDISWKQDQLVYIEGEHDETNESPWSRAFGDYDMREIIWKDTERTFREIPFFNVHNRNALARILYLLSKLNKAVEYVQGMNELLAPLLYAFAQAENPNVGIQ